MSEFGIESISAEEFRRETLPKSSKQLTTEPRTRTVWFDLPHTTGYCTVPAHEEVQKLLDPSKREYRDKYPVRHVFEIRAGLFICRDCFIAEADKDD